MINMNWLQSLIKLPRIYKDSLMALCDIGILLFSVWLSGVLANGNYGLPDYRYDDYISGFVLLVFAQIIFALSGMYQSTVRYMGYLAMLSIVRATIVFSFVLLFLRLLIDNFETNISLIQFEYREIVIFWFLITFFLVASRQTARWAFNQVGYSAKTQDYLIYGAGSAGRQATAAIAGSKDSRIIGFVDDNKKLWGRYINNYPVLGGLEKIESLVKENINVTVLLAIPSLSDSRRFEILDYLEEKSISARTLPPLRDLVLGVAEIGQIESVRIEDLLARPPVSMDFKKTKLQIADKVVIVSGAGGSIGSELCRKLIDAKPKNLLLLDHSEFNLYSIHSELLEKVEKSKIDVRVIPILGSILDCNLLDRIFNQYSINIVYHAAAYKHVPLVEDNILVGLENNVIGTYNLVKVSKKKNVTKFINVSTDKAVRPTNVMGATKRLAELIIQGMAQAVQDFHCSERHNFIYTMVRFGNVLGSSGSVVPLFRRQILEKGYVTVTHKEVTRYFMTASEAAQLVIEAGLISQGGEVFVLDMGDPIKIDDLARRMIRLSGYNVKDPNNSENISDSGKSIEIRYTGLRPGEKLYEELCLGDSLEMTSNPKVFQANEEFLAWEQIELMILKIEEAISKNDYSLARSILNEYVADYLPR